jgi:hypothetical protein
MKYQIAKKSLVSSLPARMLAIAPGVLAITLMLAARAQAQTNTLLIDPVLVSYSSQDPYGIDRAAIHTVQAGDGLSGIGLATDTVGNVPGGFMWTTIGTTGTPYDYSPFIIYDLGSPYKLATTRIWTYNEGGFMKIGPKDIALLTSNDGTNWTVLNADMPLNEGGGTTNEPAQDFATPTTNNVRYLQIQILDTWDGASYYWPAYGLSQADGNDTRDLTGLSKVRFIVNGLATPLITTQPQSQELVVPSAPAPPLPVFTVAATAAVQLGTNGLPETNVVVFGYQWYFNSNKLADNATNIIGSATTNLTITNASPANAGTYTVVITNSAGSVTSQPATLSILSDPTGVLVDPTLVGYSSTYPGINRGAIYVVEGQNDGLSGPGLDTDTVGNNPNGYMWTSAGNTISPLDWSPYLTFDLGVVGDLANTRIWQYNENGFVKFGATDIRVLTSLDDINWTILATNSLAEGGQTTNEPAQDFTNAATNIRYVQFQILGNWDGAVFWQTNVSLDSPGNTDARGITGLSKVRFDLSPHEPYVDEPPGTTNETGATVTLMAVGGSGNNAGLTYQWQYNGVNLTNGPDISGATGPTLTITALSTNDQGNYTVIVTDVNGSVMSGFIPVAVISPTESIALYAGITFSGIIGVHYQVNYESSLGPTNTWQLLQDIPSLPSSPYTVYDTTSATNKERIYEVVAILH